MRDVSPRIHVYSRREMAEAEAKAPHICMRMAERKKERENRREKEGGRQSKRTRTRTPALMHSSHVGLSYFAA